MPHDLPLGRLAREGRYADVLEEARIENGELTFPWPNQPNQGENYFWKYYLKRGTFALKDVQAKIAWKRMMPLRATLDARVHLNWPPDQGSVSLECLLYPHGIALLATVTIRQALPLSDAVLRACEARSQRIYNVTWNDGTSQSLDLNTLCQNALSTARTYAVGGHTDEGHRPSEPFTVATIIHADLPASFQLTQPTPDGSAVHRALNGLCTLDPGFQHTGLSALADSKLPTRPSADSHVLYARPSARAVWFPGAFVTRIPTRKLSCYHRNLVCASVQTEALIGLLRLGTPYLQQNRSIPSSMRKLLQSAGGLVGLLYAGSEDTYQSTSPRRQLLDSNALADINFVRQRLNGGAPIP